MSLQSCTTVYGSRDAMSKYSILIVEDHKVYSQALRRLLNTNQELNILAVMETAEQTLEQIADLRVDLVLVDISLPKMSGLDLVEKLHSLYPTQPVAILSGHLTADYVRRAMDAGARGYLVKDDPGGILEGIRRILNGESYISAEVEAH